MPNSPNTSEMEKVLEKLQKEVQELQENNHGLKENVLKLQKQVQELEGNFLEAEENNMATTIGLRKFKNELIRKSNVQVFEQKQDLRFLRPLVSLYTGQEIPDLPMTPGDFKRLLEEDANRIFGELGELEINTSGIKAIDAKTDASLVELRGQA